VVQRDASLDRLEHDIDIFCLRLLALRQPLAADLRLIVAILKVSHDLERAGDYAADVAKRSIILSAAPQVDSLDALRDMADLVRRNLVHAVNALLMADATSAWEGCQADVAVDRLYSRAFHETLARMGKDRSSPVTTAHMLFVARNLERIGDHAANVAEMAYYAARGENIPTLRPEVDDATEAHDNSSG